MKTVMKYAWFFVLVLLASPLLLLNSCGEKEMGVVSDCPSGTYLAGSTDILTGPANGTLEVGAGSTGGTVLYAPLVFTVTDQDDIPKNKVCVVLYTDGFFYTDDTYLFPLPGIGPMSRVTKVTDESGNIYMYWSTEVLPPSGADDIEGNTWVTAYSGTKQWTYTVDWTVVALTGTTTLSITTASPLPDATENTLYTPVTFAASGGTTPYTWSVGPGLPTGMTLSSAGVLSGTPAVGTGGGTTYTFTVTVTDNSAPPNAVAGSFLLTVN